MTGADIDSESPAFGGGRVGATLAAARTAAGLSLEEIARDTRVPLRHLKAIEDDAHGSLPALPYAVGFVKAFARAVKLDPEAIAIRFRAETDKTPPTPTAVMLEPFDERRLPSNGLVFASVAALVLVIGGLSAWGAGLFDPPAPSGPTLAPTAEPAASPSVTSRPATAVAPALIAAGGPVVLTAKDEVWVKISVPGQSAAVKQGILKAGETYTLPAGQQGLRLWTGKAGALAITVGGHAIPALGGPAETIRNVSLAPGDLLARAGIAMGNGMQPPPGAPGAVAPPGANETAPVAAPNAALPAIQTAPAVPGAPR